MSPTPLCDPGFSFGAQRTQRLRRRHQFRGAIRRRAGGAPGVLLDSARTWDVPARARDDRGATGSKAAAGVRGVRRTLEEALVTIKGMKAEAAEAEAWLKRQDERRKGGT